MHTTREVSSRPDMKIVREIDPGSAEANATRDRAIGGQTGRKPQVFRLAERKLVTFPKTAF